MSKLKASADDSLIVILTVQSLFERMEKMWKKEKMFVTSTFPFSNKVFENLQFVYMCILPQFIRTGCTLAGVSNRTYKI